MARGGLGPREVPGPPAPWWQVPLFAYEFDGQEVFGGFDSLAELANGWRDRGLADRSLPVRLCDLRGWLFFEQRRPHHFGEALTGEDARDVRSYRRGDSRVGEQDLARWRGMRFLGCSCRIPRA